MIELEKTYLAKFIPDDLGDCEHKEIIDVYVPKESIHPSLRLRKNGNHFEMTKKEPLKEGDASQQREQTIILTKQEFTTLNNQVEGKRIRKIRYQFKHKNNTAEIDVFQDTLAGLVLADIEFKNNDDKNNFQIPDFCLAEVTQETFLAGGMLCGKSYGDIESGLDKFGYKKLIDLSGN